MKKLLVLLTVLAAFIAYTLSDGSSYSGMVIGIIVLPLVVVMQLIFSRLLLPESSKS